MKPLDTPSVAAVLEAAGPLSMLCPRTFCLWRSGESLPDFHCFHTWRGNVPMTGRYLCLFCNNETKEPA